MKLPKVLFVHPTKTGGTTAQAVLKEALGDRLYYVGNRFWRSSRVNRIKPDLIVATCRHPAARFVSGWYDLAFRRRFRIGWRDRNGSAFVKRWRTMPDLLLYACDDEILKQTKFAKQVRWLAPGGSLVTDRLLRCETLEGDLVALLAEFGLPAPEIPRVNTTEHPPWEDLLTAAMLRRIERLYSDDYRVLGYPLSSSTGG